MMGCGGANSPILTTAPAPKFGFASNGTISVGFLNPTPHQAGEFSFEVPEGAGSLIVWLEGEEGNPSGIVLHPEGKPDTRIHIDGGKLCGTGLASISPGESQEEFEAAVEGRTNVVVADVPGGREFLVMRPQSGRWLVRSDGKGDAIPVGLAVASTDGFAFTPADASIEAQARQLAELSSRGVAVSSTMLSALRWVYSSVWSGGTARILWALAASGMWIVVILFSGLIVWLAYQVFSMSKESWVNMIANWLRSREASP